MIKLDLNPDFAARLSDDLQHVFQMMIGEGPTAGPFSVRESIELKGDISGIVSLTQEGFDASCFLIFSSNCIFYILEKFYQGRKFNSLSDDSVRQGVAELTNIIFGTLKSKLNDTGFSLKMGLPKVIIGSQHIVLATAPKSLYLPFDLGGNKAEVMFTLANWNP